MSETKPPRIVLKAQPLRARLGPIGFRDFAAQFLTAGRATQVDGRPVVPVTYFLYCKSIELSLKAYLLAQRASLRELKARKLGHDIARLLIEAEALSLSKCVVLSHEQKQAIIVARPYYTEKVFEYFTLIPAITGYRAAPNITHLETAAADLYSGIEAVCIAATHDT